MFPWLHGISDDGRKGQEMAQFFGCAMSFCLKKGLAHVCFEDILHRLNLHPIGAFVFSFVHLILLTNTICALRHSATTQIWLLFPQAHRTKYLIAKTPSLNPLLRNRTILAVQLNWHPQALAILYLHLVFRLSNLFRKLILNQWIHPRMAAMVLRSPCTLAIQNVFHQQQWQKAWMRTTIPFPVAAWSVLQPNLNPENRRYLPVSHHQVLTSTKQSDKIKIPLASCSTHCMSMIYSIFRKLAMTQKNDPVSELQNFLTKSI